MRPLEAIRIEIAKLELRPDDILVVWFPDGEFEASNLEALRALAAEQGVSLWALPKSIDLDVLRKVN